MASSCSPELGVDHRVPPQPDRRLVTDPATTTAPGLALSTPAAGGIIIAELSGELDLTCAPALREQLLGLLRPGSSRLVIDLSKVSHCDASGLAVLIGTGRRARLLGGFCAWPRFHRKWTKRCTSPDCASISASSPPSRPRQPARRVPTAKRAQRRRCTRSTRRWRLEDGPEAGRVTVSLTRRRASCQRCSRRSSSSGHHRDDDPRDQVGQHASPGGPAARPKDGTALSRRCVC
jgi:anti-anti-sigma factor